MRGSRETEERSIVTIAIQKNKHLLALSPWVSPKEGPIAVVTRIF